MQPAEKKQLGTLLRELAGAVDELMLAGLTAASKSTIERIDVTFKEAARMRLLRLGATLRIANEEISRFTTGSTHFSARRLAFFLGRTWLLARAMGEALEKNDDAALAKLMAIPAPIPVEKLKVVTLGVGKRVVPGAVATFEFRLRVIEEARAATPGAAPIPAGEALVLSFVFPMRKDVDLPAEAYLHLPQKQKFKPSLLLEKNVVEISKCAISRQPAAAARLSLGDASELKAGAPFKDWGPFWTWTPDAAANRLRQYQPTPLDLEIELQEEVFLQEWAPAEKKASGEGYDELSLLSSSLEFSARLDRGPSGVPLRAVVTKMAEKKQRPPLYGITHYEACKLVFQPLTALGRDGPEYLTVSAEKISQAELVKAMKFT
jgi:hypothetical protein